MFKGQTQALMGWYKYNLGIESATLQSGPYIVPRAYFEGVVALRQAPPFLPPYLIFLNVHQTDAIF